MAYIDKNPAMVLNELASLNPQQRREVAAALRGVAETFTGVPDGRHAAHTLRLLAHLLTAADGADPVLVTVSKETYEGLKS